MVREIRLDVRLVDGAVVFDVLQVVRDLIQLDLPLARRWSP